MKKLLLSVLLFCCTISWGQFNFEFEIYNADGVLLASVDDIVYNGHGGLILREIDLSDQVCEGEILTLKNYSSGSYDNHHITPNTEWDIREGHYITSPPVSWTISTLIIDDQHWYDTISAQYTIPNSSDPGPYAYHTLLIGPEDLGGHFNGAYNTNPGCLNIIALDLKVKKAPPCITAKDICPDTVITNELLGIQEGTTATNWFPEDPRIDSPLQDTNYTVILDNGNCSFECSFSINILEPEYPLFTETVVCGDDLPYLSNVGVFDYDQYETITVNGTIVFNNYDIIDTDYFLDEKLVLDAPGIHTIHVSYNIYSPLVGVNVLCTKEYTVEILNPISIPDTVVLCGGNNELCGPDGDYSYQWSGPSPFVSTNKCFTPTQEGSYSLSITNGHGCFQTKPFNVIHEIPQPSLGSNIPICRGEPVPLIKLEPETSYNFPGVNIVWKVNNVVVQIGGTEFLYTSSPTSNLIVTAEVSKPGCIMKKDSIRVIVRKCDPTAEFTIENIESTSTERSLYGPAEVHTLCLPDVIIDGSLSMYETQYHIRIAEFDLMNWTFINDLYDNWVASGEVPAYINLSDLSSNVVFEPGKLYIIILTVGPGWFSAPPQFFRVETCVIGEEPGFSQKNVIEQQSGDIMLYPNPAADIVTVNLNQVQSGNISVYSIEGKIVSERAFTALNELTLDLSPYAEGIYMVKVQIGEEIITKRIIKE